MRWLQIENCAAAAVDDIAAVVAVDIAVVVAVVVAVDEGQADLLLCHQSRP